MRSLRMKNLLGNQNHKRPRGPKHPSWSTSLRQKRRLQSMTRSPRRKGSWNPSRAPTTRARNSNHSSPRCLQQPKSLEERNRISLPVSPSSRTRKSSPSLAPRKGASFITARPRLLHTQPPPSPTKLQPKRSKSQSRGQPRPQLL